MKTTYTIPLTLNTPAFNETWTAWLEDRTQRRKPVTSFAARLQLRLLEAMGPERAVQSIEQSVMQGWTGLFDPLNGTQNSYKSKAQSNGELGGADKVILGEELKRIGVRVKTLQDSYDSHQNWSDRDRKTLSELSSRRKEIKTTLGIKY